MLYNTKGGRHLKSSTGEKATKDVGPEVIKEGHLINKIEQVIIGKRTQHSQ